MAAEGKRVESSTAERASIPSESPEGVVRAGTVVVAILTYRRPDDLCRVLPEVEAQAVAAAHLAERIDVLVVDNDPAGSGRPTVEAAGLARVRYVHEPAPGIAAGRNRALAEAGDHDVLVFLDDDEHPREGWLRLLLATFLAGGPDGEALAGVVGPVVSEYEVPLSPWVRAGGFFDRRRLPTGTAVTVAATNNLLLDLHRVRAADLAFDERFGLSGGSDTLFTRALVAAGGRLVWCDEAIVTDVVPAARTERSWVVRRQVRSGNSWSRTELDLRPGFVTRAKLVVLGGVRVLGGAAKLALGFVTRDLGRRARGTKLMARGGGMVLGAVGYVHVEYRRRG
jgi:succinoglycan biosynthesis protein ExoM